MPPSSKKNVKKSAPKTKKPVKAAPTKTAPVQEPAPAPAPVQETVAPVTTEAPVVNDIALS